MWNSGKGFCLGLCLCMCLLVFPISSSEAAEVCVDKGEFASAMQRWQIDQKKIKVHEEKATTHVKLIAELKAHIADQDTQLAAGEKYKDAAEPLIEALEKRTQELEQAEKDHEYSVWMERGKGFAVGVGLGMLYLIVK